MINLLTPPIFDNEDKTLVARHLFIIAWTFISIGWLPLIIAIFLPETVLRWMLIAGYIELSGLILLVLNKYGHTRLAKYLLIFFLWAAATGMAATGGGVSSNAMSIYLIIVLIAGLLQSGEAGVITAVLCSATGLYLVNLEYSGSLPAKQVFHTPLTEWIANTIYMFIIVSLQYLVSGTVRKALSQSRQELKERIRADAALRESEAHYRLLADHMKDVVWLMDMNMKTTFRSPSAYKSRGYTLEEFQEPLDKNLTPASVELATGAFLEEMSKVKADPNYTFMRKLELEFYCKGETTLWAECTFSPIYDENGKPLILCEARDITERKRVEDQLLETGERYRRMVENASDIIFRTDSTGHFTFVNPAALSSTGYKEEEVIGMHYPAIIRRDMRDEAIKLFGRQFVKEIKNTYSEFPVVAKDGHEIWLGQNTQLIVENGNVNGFQSVARDITERKQAQDALRESEERYRGILEEMDEAYAELDLKGRFTFFNEAMCKTLGYNRSELMGMDNRAYTTPECARKALQIFNDIYQTGIPKAMMAYEVIRKNGEKRILETSILPINKYAGEIIGFRCVSRDATQRIKAEEAQRILEERLQQADKMESIGTLAGGIAHDFNNLLAGIQGFVSMMVMNLKDNDPNYERLQRIQDQVQSGGDLTRQLLGFARGGRYEIKPSDMNEILEKTSSMFGRTKKEISIQRKSGKDLWSAEVDRGQMEQVFMNLYVNASQAMPEGGDIYLETQNVFLNDEKNFPYFMKPGKYVKISITDTGTGMDEKTKEKIFEPFFTTKAMGRGTGLGMATVYGIVKGHGGMINVESEPGNGTTFIIYLPASEKEVQREDAPADEIVTGTETILLIDDEKVVMEVNKELLESLGYTVYAAGSGQEGIAVYMEKKDKIHLIILDMIMPGISGSDTFDRLRQINPNVKVLLSSGYSLTGKAQAIMDRGCNGFLQKPFRLEELSSKVREMLN